MKRNLIISTLFLASLCACQRDRNNPVSGAVEAAKDPGLQGSFTSACTVTKKPGGLTQAVTESVLSGLSEFSGFQTVSYVFRGDTVVRVTDHFASSDCSGHATNTRSEQGTIKIDDSKKTKDQARFIDFAYKKLSAQFSSPPAVSFANKLNVCGKSNWSQGNEQDVEDAKTPEFTCNYGVKIPRADYNVYRLEGTTLTMGSGAQEEAKRPTELDKNNVYHKDVK